MIRVHSERSLESICFESLLPVWHTRRTPRLDRSCFGCKQQVEHRHVCGVCSIPVYCSRKCQEKDWQRHQPVCKDGQTFLRRVPAKLFKQQLRSFQQNGMVDYLTFADYLRYWSFLEQHPQQVVYGIMMIKGVGYHMEFCINLIVRGSPTDLIHRKNYTANHQGGWEMIDKTAAEDCVNLFHLFSAWETGLNPWANMLLHQSIRLQDLGRSSELIEDFQQKYDAASKGLILNYCAEEKTWVNCDTLSCSKCDRIKAKGDFPLAERIKKARRRCLDCCSFFRKSLPKT